MTHEATRAGRLAIPVLVLLGLVIVAGPAAAGETPPAPAEASQPSAGQPEERPATEGFVPIGDLPPDEQLPAAPFLVSAYAIVWLVILGYVWYLWRRLGRVERELGELLRGDRPD